MDFSEQDYLQLCKSRIEDKYRLGNVDQGLKQRDFEYLIDLIEETSGIKLSVSTLKRLWRKTEEQNPHPSTLDALVSILGFKDWLDFKVRNALTDEDAASKHVEDIPEPKGGFTGRKKVPLLIAASIVSITLISLLIISFTSDNSGNPEHTSDVLFSVSNSVSAGVPNTVIFNYDVSGVVADSFYIQRDWDPNNIAKIDPASNYSTNVYYLPGFHRARLIADGQVLKTTEVNIQTAGWLGAAYYTYDESPIYVPSVEAREGILSIRESDLTENGANMDRVRGAMLTNIGALGNLDSNNFLAETRFRFRELQAAACYGVQFTIHTEANIFFTQFGPAGCVGVMELLIGDTYLSGNNNDLSAFGTNVREWQELSFRVEQKQVTITLNGVVILETSFNDDFGKIVGIDYRFDGLGDVDYLRLRNLDDMVVYDEQF